jgi:hypothetical protein
MVFSVIDGVEIHRERGRESRLPRAGYASYSDE